MFLTALGVVSTMLLYAVPGFLFIKTKLVKSDSISAFAKLLLYVCSPCLMIHSITRNKFTKELAIDMVLSLAIILFIVLSMLLLFFFIFKKKQGDVRYRIYNLAVTFANCGFMGVPILEALFPDFPQAVVFSAMFSLANNVLGWTVGSFIISRDKKHVSIKKIILNPATLAIFVALPLFFFEVQIPSLIYNMIMLLGKMTTPLCMIIMGMRLACASPKDVFLTPLQYLIIGIKQLLLPLISFLILLPLPVDTGMKAAIYVMMACPVASVVLNFSELIGQGQKHAASLVLLGTTLSAVTIPLMSLLIPFLL